MAERIRRALRDARSVVNVGAGTGSYEPRDRDVIAVEPSAVMITQRPPGSSITGTMRARVSRRWLAWLAIVSSSLRSTRNPLASTGSSAITSPSGPSTARRPSPRLPNFSTLSQPARCSPCWFPRDCTDRMFATLWARPEQYLDPQVRGATSTWHQLPASVAGRAIRQLRRDLSSGKWDERYGHLRTTPVFGRRSAPDTSGARTRLIGRSVEGLAKCASRVVDAGSHGRSIGSYPMRGRVLPQSRLTTYPAPTASAHAAA